MIRADARAFRIALLTAGVGVYLAVSGCGESPEVGASHRSDREVVRWEVEPGVTSSPDAAFAYVTAVDVDSRGRMYVGDWSNAEVTVLSPEGEVERRIGRRGEGPGEFNSVRQVQVLPGDSLLVFDNGLKRITVFAPNSDEVVYVTNLAMASSANSPGWIRRTHRNRELVAAYSRPFRPSDDPREDETRGDVVRLLDTEGSILRDELLNFPAKQDLVVREGGGISVSSHPFGRKGVVALGPDDRIYYGWTDSLAVEIYSLEGERVGGFSAPHRRTPLAPEHIEEVIAGKKDSWAQKFGRTLRESAPETWPAFRSLVVDDRSRLWVGLVGSPAEPAEWAVFAPSGAYLGSVFLPDSVEIKAVRDQTVYGIAHDEFDVPRVVVYGIREPAKEAHAGGPPRSGLVLASALGRPVRLFGLIGQQARPDPAWGAIEVNEVGIQVAAKQLSDMAGGDDRDVARRLRHLQDRPGAGLYLQITSSSRPLTVVLQPSREGAARMSVGGGSLVWGGADSRVGGVGAFWVKDAPQREYVIQLPPAVTHATVVVSGREIATAYQIDPAGEPVTFRVESSSR